MTSPTGYCGTPFKFDSLEIDVDGRMDRLGVVFIGKARLQPDGTWRCLANVAGALCLVEVSMSFAEQE